MYIDLIPIRAPYEETVLPLLVSLEPYKVLLLNDYFYAPMHTLLL